MFASEAKSLQQREPTLVCSTLVGSSLTRNYYNRPERLAKDKQSSLLGALVY